MSGEFRPQSARLFAVCGKASQFPEPSLPEIAFVGRSNVGKSSLINDLLGRKALARTSSQPGKTQTINWYSVDEKLFFVDLPGYGYAKTSAAERERWGRVVDAYFKKRTSLRAAVLIADIRHEVSGLDEIMREYLNAYEVPAIIVGTKSDKVNWSALPRHIKMLAEAFSVPAQDVIAYSTLHTEKNRENEVQKSRQRLWEAILSAARGENS